MATCEDWTRDNVMMWSGGSTRVGPCGRRVMGLCSEVYKDFQSVDAAAFPSQAGGALDDDGSISYLTHGRGLNNG